MRKVALLGLITIFSLIILFHLLVLIGVVPSSIVWGGRAANRQELIGLEIISIALNSIFLMLSLILNGNLKINLKPWIIKIVLWFMSIIFLLNTLGNLMAKSSIETIIFTPITILLSVFSLYLAITERK
jgi:hypothetical protein